VGTANTTLRRRKIYNLLKSNRSKLILFNTSDSRYLYYVKYSHNLWTYSITIKNAMPFAVLAEYSEQGQFKAIVISSD
jgi:hypothetical protein